MFRDVLRLHKGSVSGSLARDQAPSSADLRDSREGTLAFLAPLSFGASSTFEPQAAAFDYDHCEPLATFQPGLREIVATPYGRPAISLVMVDPDFPNAHRAALPVHEREISAESLGMLRAGVEDVRAGRARKLNLDDLKSSDDE